MMGQSAPDVAGAPHAPEVRADALRLLASGRPVPFVAAQLGIPARTVRLWARQARPAPARPAPARPALAVVREAGVEVIEAPAAVRTRAIARAAEWLRLAPVERLAEFLSRVWDGEAAATGAGDLGALARLLSLEARITRLDTVEVCVQVGPAPPRTREDVLGLIRALPRGLVLAALDSEAS